MDTPTVSVAAPAAALAAAGDSSGGDSNSNKEETSSALAAKGRADFTAKIHYFVFIGIMIAMASIVVLVCVSTTNTAVAADPTAPPHCPQGTYPCSTGGLCINSSLVCDRKKDCTDGSDEGSVCDQGRLVMTGELFRKRDDDGREQEENNCNLTILPSACTCRQKTKVYCNNKSLLYVPQPLPPETSVLDLSVNNITTISKDKMTGLPHLVSLIITHTSLHTIKPNTFIGSPNLTMVSLKYNQLVSFSTNIFPVVNRVKELKLMGNALTQLHHKDFQNMAMLSKLDLRNNRIHSIEEGVFQNMPNLIVLDLRGNVISRIEDHFFSNLGKLRSLLLSNNAINNIVPGAFSSLHNLQTLNLAGNRIQHLRNGIFAGLANLGTLELRGNGISEIESLVFKPLIKTTSVDLRSNAFKTVPNGTFSYMHSLSYIYFDKFYMCLYASQAKLCEPQGDGISSKENLLESVVLRICVWMVALLACGGNLLVILGRFLLREDNQIHSFFIKNLSLADLLMGLYLLIIAVHDIKYRGEYILYDESWRYSWECDMSGVLSTLSTEMSVLTLSVITLDRYLSIMYPLSFRKRGLKVAYCVMAFTWSVCIVLATLPVMGLDYFGSSFYRDNAVCIPLHLHDPRAKGWEYSSFLFLGINFGSFGFIAYAYVAMFYSIHMSSLPLRTSRESKERCLVKRFFFIVVTDFMCWVPIIVVKILALSGVAITVELYAWVIVFVLPVNSALNPLLYTLTTKLFKKKLLSKFSSVVFRPANRGDKDSTQSRSSIKNNTLFTRQMQELELDLLRRYGNSSRTNNLRASLSTGCTTSTTINGNPPPRGSPHSRSHSHSSTTLCIPSNCSTSTGENKRLLMDNSHV